MRLVEVGRRLAAEHRDDVFYGDDVELVVDLEVDGDCVFGVEKDFVVLFEGYVLIVFDLLADRNDSTGNRWNFGRVREGDTAPGLPFRFVFSDENAVSDRFDVVKVRRFFCHGSSIGEERKSTSTFGLASPGKFVILLGFPQTKTTAGLRGDRELICVDLSMRVVILAPE